MKRILAIALLLWFSVLPVERVYAKTALDLPEVATSVTPFCVTSSPISLTIGDEKIAFFSCATEPEAILEEVGKDFGDFEIVSDVKDAQVRNIVLIPVERKRVLLWEKIAYSTDVTYTKELPHRKTVVEKKGVNGKRGVIKEETTYPDGKKVTKTISRWTEQEPITAQVRTGTQYDLKTIEIDGKKVYYWRTLTVKATSYDSSCKGCNHTTATGAYLRKGIVAVDPKVIPMHTKMYIPGYGFGQAEDTGGMIKGNRIDLAYDDIRYGDWSRRWVTIYLID